MSRPSTSRRTLLRTCGLVAGNTVIGVTSAGAATAAFGPSGSVPLPDAADAVVDEDGVHVYVAVGDGFAVVDTSDPARPEVVVERRGLLEDRARGPVERYRDVSADGNPSSSSARTTIPWTS